MSGPKSSRYTLTPEQRRILAEQRRIERAKAVANEIIKRNRVALKRLSIAAQHETIVAEEAVSRLGNDGGYAQKTNELLRVISEAETTVARVDSNSLSSLESAAKATSESLKKAEQLKKEIQNIVSACEAKVRTDIAAALDDSFSASFADIRPAVSNVSQKKEEIRSRIQTVRKTAVLSEELYAELVHAEKLTTAILDEQFLKNHIAITVNPLLKRCAAYAEAYRAHHEEYETLYSEYTALCELYHFAAQQYPFSVESISVLQTEIERIKATAEKQAEQAYIQQALDEVMTEMGYSVIGSREVTKRNGRHFRNELFTYGEGTAVNVTYSPDGKIAMELGGLDTTDRIPTDTESAALCGEMESFCDSFKEIEKRLLAKGVVLASRVQLLPPDAAYASIINTSDYDMKSQTKRFSAQTHRGKAAEKKTMKAE